MSNVVRIAAARWRHFIPQAETLTKKIPFYQAQRNEDGTQSVIEKYRFDYVVETRNNAGYNYFDFPAHVIPSDLSSISVWYNGVLQNNDRVLLYVQESKLGDYNVNGPRTFTYEAPSNQLRYQWIIQTGVNRAPTIGTAVTIEVLNESSTENMYVYIPMKKWLIQGANPIDASIIGKEDESGMQFQGGYRCTLKMLSKPAHGHARVAYNKLGFEYRPDMGYFGTDEFAYCVVNAMGQESEAHCIHLDVGTNLL